MSPVGKESEARRNHFDAKSVAAPIKRNAPKDGKKYLPSFAFNKTVKSTATKSLLKFRQRQEQHDFKKAQQYKSYQRVMKREGYGTDKDKNNRKRHRDENGNNEDSDSGSDTKNNFDNDTSPLKLNNIAGLNDSVSEQMHDSHDDKNMQESNIEKLTIVSMNKPDSTEINSNERKQILKTSGDDLQKSKNKQSDKWNKKRNQVQEEQRRAAEYSERQIQMEREKKEKLKRRQERTRLLSARTSKGQPIMKNIAMDILNKLQREQQLQQQQRH